jgi:predicted DCC family thiol-disulfide oxidoreductase YuxK
VHTEITETMKGWVYFDADCVFCSVLAARTDGLLARRGFHLAALQNNWVREKLGLKEGGPLTEMKLLTADGQVYGGADAIIQIARSIWWARPLFAFSRLPGAETALRGIYQRIAINRGCHGGKCAMTKKPVSRHHHLASSFYDLSE